MYASRNPFQRVNPFRPHPTYDEKRDLARNWAASPNSPRYGKDTDITSLLRNSPFVGSSSSITNLQRSRPQNQKMENPFLRKQLLQRDPNSLVENSYHSYYTDIDLPRPQFETRQPIETLLSSAEIKPAPLIPLQKRNSIEDIKSSYVYDAPHRYTEREESYPSAAPIRDKVERVDYVSYSHELPPSRPSRDPKEEPNMYAYKPYEPNIHENPISETYQVNGRTSIQTGTILVKGKLFYPCEIHPM